MSAAAIALPKLFSFLFFLFLGVRVARAREAARKRAVALLICYVVAVNSLAGVTQWDDWPFTNHMLAVGRGTDQSVVRIDTFYGVDGKGREWRLDPYTFSPVFDSILQAWMDMTYFSLPPAQQREAGLFLLAKANQSRARLAEGKRIGFDRRLGFVACPYWWRLQRHLTAPAEPYRALRVYDVRFAVGDVERFPGRVQRKLIAEVRE